MLINIWCCKLLWEVKHLIVTNSYWWCNQKRNQTYPILTAWNCTQRFAMICKSIIKFVEEKCDLFYGFFRSDMPRFCSLSKSNSAVVGLISGDEGSAICPCDGFSSGDFWTPSVCGSGFCEVSSCLVVGSFGGFGIFFDWELAYR